MDKKLEKLSTLSYGQKIDKMNGLKDKMLPSSPSSFLHYCHHQSPSDHLLLLSLHCEQWVPRDRTSLGSERGVEARTLFVTPLNEHPWESATQVISKTREVRESMVGRSLRSRVIPDPAREPEAPPPPSRTTAAEARSKHHPQVGIHPSQLADVATRSLLPGERDTVLALRWIEEIEMVFETCRCAAEDKVVFARSMLKADALHSWNMETRGRGTEAVRSMSWKSFVTKFMSQLCPLAATKKM
ncbi:hypothetical protein OSB04_028337 [Centaurea solstitialis]|uniref:Uncharacterized protein n=1 Tax=Centaurea solstitialis TaxID=347529 RepID=A0AA38STT9_9ASTR|nr:hypothetical protein OSB04_028337 [Centaurea solstitialis]